MNNNVPMQEPEDNNLLKASDEDVILIEWGFIGKAGTPDLINIPEVEVREWIERLPFGKAEKESLYRKIISIRNESK